MGEKVRRNVEDLQVSHSASSAGGFLTISVGGASMIPRRSDSFVALIETADVALYQAKRSGKNRVVTLGQTGSQNPQMFPPEEAARALVKAAREYVLSSACS